MEEDKSAPKSQASQKLEKAQQELKTKQIEAIEDLTMDGKLSIRQPQVKEAISHNEYLQGLSNKQLSDISKSTLQKRKRLEASLKGPANLQIIISSDDDAEVDFSCEQASHESEYEPLDQETGSQKKRNAKKQEKQEQQVWPHTEARSFIQFASKQIDGNNFKEALVERITCPQADLSEEYNKLSYLYTEQCADELAIEIALDPDFELDYKQEARERPLIVVRAFLKVAQLNADRVWDQFLIDNLFLPALKACQALPTAFQEMPREANLLYRSSLKLLRDSGGQAPLEIFNLGHALGNIREVATRFCQAREGKKTFYRFLGGLGYTHKIAQLLSEDPTRYAYSTFLNQMLKVKDQNSLKTICDTLKRVLVVQDPTENAQKLAQLFRKRTCLGQELTAQDQMLDITLRDLVRVSEMIIELERSDIAKIICQPASTWVQQAQLLVNQTKNQRPILLQNEDYFDNLAFQEDIVKQYETTQQLAGELQIQCDRFTANPFQSYVTAKIIDANSHITVVTLPSGSGKTFICALLAKYKTKQGLKTAIVTNENYLVSQMEQMFGDYGSDTTIITMEQAILRRDEFDCFIIDEADNCILEHGAVIDPINETFVGFWDLLEKQSILLSATASYDFSYILKNIFDINRDQNIDFTTIIKNVEKAACATEIDYQIERTNEEFWTAVQNSIRSKIDTEPVIVFVDTKSKAKKVKDVCKELDVPCYQILDDSQVLPVLAIIKSQERGVVVALEQYGRGTDICFKVDSFVLIAYKPLRMDIVRQMSGRSSRSLKRHVSKIIMIDQRLHAADMEDCLIGHNFSFLKDGITIAQIMRGRRRMKETSDTPLLKLLKTTWMVKANKIKGLLTPKVTAKFQKEGSWFIQRPLE